MTYHASRILAFFGLALLLSACSQSSETINTTLSQPSEPTQLTETALLSDPATNPTGNILDNQLQSGDGEPVIFLPLEGVPTRASSSLSRSLQQSASTRGIALQRRAGNAQYQLKGYFSALNDGSGTLLVYVWDVLDSSGKRVHRINGQERNSNNRADPWLAINEDDLARVAETTAQALQTWVETKRG